MGGLSLCLKGKIVFFSSSSPSPLCQHLWRLLKSLVNTAEASTSKPLTDLQFSQTRDTFATAAAFPHKRPRLTQSQTTLDPHRLGRVRRRYNTCNLFVGGLACMRGLRSSTAEAVALKLNSGRHGWGKVTAVDRAKAWASQGYQIGDWSVRGAGYCGLAFPKVKNKPNR